MNKSILDGRYQTIFAGKKTIMSGITGKIKNQVDAIWMSFWTGGITNSIDVLEQLQNEITEAMNEFKTKYMK